jgi:hypothetical protein
VDGEDERQRAMETGYWGGQGSTRAVAPRGWMDMYINAQCTKTAKACSSVVHKFRVRYNC